MDICMENSLISTSSSSSGNVTNTRLNQTKKIIHYINSDDPKDIADFIRLIRKGNLKFNDTEVYNVAIQHDKLFHLMVLISYRNSTNKKTKPTSTPFMDTPIITAINKKNDLGLAMLCYLPDEAFSLLTRVDNFTAISSAILNGEVLSTLILLGQGRGPINTDAKKSINNTQNRIKPEISYLVKHADYYIAPYRIEYIKIVNIIKFIMVDLERNLLGDIEEKIIPALKLFNICKANAKDELKLLNDKITQQITATIGHQELQLNNYEYITGTDENNRLAACRQFHPIFFPDN